VGIVFDSVDEQHLDALRIRQATALRRSLYRSRAYAVIAAIACAAAAAQCAWLALRHVRALGWGVRPTVLVVLMVAAGAGALFFARRASSLNREAAATVLPEPTTPPDFSALNDGSQRARNLDDVR
jgi:hypothetical protein